MISKFIKDLLKDTYVPTVPIWNDNDPLVKDMIYVTKEYIVKAKKNYNPSTSNNISVFNNDYFKIICPYIFGQFYQGVTSNFKSSSWYGLFIKVSSPNIHKPYLAVSALLNISISL